MAGLGDKVARRITAIMATWSFIGAFLACCIVELIGNHYGFFKFDPSTVILNLILSLMAAIQGSIIMIAQNQADLTRDEMLKTIIKIQKDMIEHISGEESTISETHKLINEIHSKVFEEK